MYDLREEDQVLYDQKHLSIQGLVDAYKAKDPRLAEYAIKLVRLDPYPEETETVSKITCSIVGHTEHGMSTIHQAMKQYFGDQKGHTTNDDDDVFEYIDPDGLHICMMDAAGRYVTPSSKELKQAQILVLVVAADDGVMPQTKDLIKTAHQADISKVTIFINKVDQFDEGERDEQVALVKSEVEELLEFHGFDVNEDSFVIGSGLLALQGSSSELGKSSIERLCTNIKGVEPIHTEVSRVLRQYEEFRCAYHLDAIDTKILDTVEPVIVYEKHQFSHQHIRQRKAQLFSQRFTQFLETYPEHVPERLKVGEFMLMLYDDTSEYATEQLLEMIRYIPLKWGPWQAFKYIMKRGILDQRWTLFAFAYNRWRSPVSVIATGRNFRTDLPSRYLPNDMSALEWDYLYAYVDEDPGIEITTETRKFLNRMFTKGFREQFEFLSSAIQEAVTVEILMVAPTFRRSWYFRDIWVEWANNLTWTTQSEGLFRLWERAKCFEIRRWAFDMLLEYHASELNKLPADWVIKHGLDVEMDSEIRDFIINWICLSSVESTESNPHPRTEIPKSDFIKHGLHEVVLTFLDPNYGSLQDISVRYACNFIRQFMEELTDFITLDRVLWLLRHRRSDIHELGLYLLFPDGEKDSPYQEQLNLEFWTDLLSDSKMYSYAVQAIKDRYKNQIGIEWLKGRLYSSNKKEVTLAKNFIRDGFHRPNLDFYPVYYQNIFTTQGRYSLYDWAWSALNKEDETGSSLIKENFTGADYRKMLVSRSVQNVKHSIDAYNNELVSDDDFPIDFLKHLICNEDFQLKEWNVFIEGDVDVASSLPKTLRSFAATSIFNRPDCSLDTLGIKWVLDRRQSRARNMSQVRSLFFHKFPNHQLQLLENPELTDVEPTEENNQKGVEIILDLIDRGLYYKNDDAIFWMKFLFARLERNMEQQGIENQYSDDCLVTPTHFSLQWFAEQIDDSKHRSEHHRKFALDMAKLYLTDWIQTSQPFGFKELVPFLFCSYSEVSSFIEQAIENPTSQHAHIDILTETFTSDDLFTYCYSSDVRIRTAGLTFIKKYPEKFAQPDKLIELTTSPDTNVRSMVIEILYDIAKIPLVTSNWTPYEDSVVPNNTTKPKKDKVVVFDRFPPKDTPVGVGKYLGEGTPSNLEPNLTERGSLVLFAVRQLFQIPSYPRKRSERGVEKIPSWKMKRLLIESFRDLAIQDREFAEMIVPVFEELTKYRGVMVRESSWAALSYLEAHYSDTPLKSLTIFSEEQKESSHPSGAT